MRFEWDDKKNKLNIKKHGLSFNEAVRVFLDPNLLVVPDPEQSEDRWDAIGFVGTILFVVYTEREEDTIRIISARKATKRKKMDTKIITLEEVKKMDKLSQERLYQIEDFKDDDISDTCELSNLQIKQLKPFYQLHPEWYKLVVAKTPVQIRIDNDVLAVLKKEGKGYQTKINAILRKYVFG